MKQTDDTPDWLKKCIRCQHSYTRKDDDECMYCRKRNGKCEFKEFKGKKEKKHEN